METRIKNAIEKYEREQERIKRKIKEAEWCIKNIPSTEETKETLRTEIRLLKDQAVLIRAIRNDLEWISKGI